MILCLLFIYVTLQVLKVVSFKSTELNFNKIILGIKLGDINAPFIN